MDAEELWKAWDKSKRPLAAVESFRNAGGRWTHLNHYAAER